MKLAGAWRSLGSGVYESLNKSRIHINGIVGIKGEDHKFEYEFQDEFYKCLKICGGNRKRALMLAAELMERGEI